MILHVTQTENEFEMHVYVWIYGTFGVAFMFGMSWIMVGLSGLVFAFQL
jgi:hypothetical protein